MSASLLSHLKRVLVLEDEPLILMDLEDMLLEAGAGSVVSVTSVVEAEAAIRSAPVDAAILDLHIGSQDWSYGVARQLRDLSVHFIFTSGSVGLADDFGDVPLIEKPFSSAQLLAVLSEETAPLQAAE